MTWACFLLEPTDRVSRWLRRYAALYRAEPPYAEVPAARCALSGSTYHDAAVRIEDGPLVWFEEPDGVYFTDPEEWPHDDPRWPTRCPCGYAFGPDDQWDLPYGRLFRDPRDGGEFSLFEAPAGAMFVLAWDLFHLYGRDKRGLGVVLPDGSSWAIDGPAGDGPGWDRTGEPPHITARPSILTPRYHGWLTDGVLSDDLEGRVY